MKFVFEQKLDQELLLSEKKRTIILIAIFSMASIFRLADVFLFKMDKEFAFVTSFSTVWLFPMAIVLFEIGSLLYINRRIRTKKKGLPLAGQFINTAFEICLPSLIILYVAKQFPGHDVMKSPAVLIYFLFIILSTLRLNFLLSFFCGLLSSLSYISFSLLLKNHFTSYDATRAVIILFAGIASGLVAMQIRIGISNSLKETERRRKVENIFGQQLSAEVAGKMIENDGQIETKRMQVAIMFIDIRNFTNFASGRKPEEIVKYQNDFFRIVINTVSKFHGVIHQFLGDGCMVTFGAPINLKNPAQHAVEAGVNLLAAIERAIKAGELQPTRIGMGIHTGEVVTGNIGTEERQQYSITGNVVILASRIEQLNKQFGSQLLVSEEVVHSIEQTNKETNFLGTVALKGWHKPISIYKLA